MIFTVSERPCFRISLIPSFVKKCSKLAEIWVIPLSTFSSLRSFVEAKENKRSVFLLPRKSNTFFLRLLFLSCFDIPISRSRRRGADKSDDTHKCMNLTFRIHSRVYFVRVATKWDSEIRGTWDHFRGSYELFDFVATRAVKELCVAREWDFRFIARRTIDLGVYVRS